MARKRIKVEEFPDGTTADFEIDRLTVLLGHDTVQGLNRMAQLGRFRGKGRTIDALVEGVLDLRPYLDGFFRASATSALLGQNPQLPNSQALQQQQVLAMLVSSGVIADRLGKFVGVRPGPIIKEVQVEFEKWKKTQLPQVRIEKGGEGPSK